MRQLVVNAVPLQTLRDTEKPDKNARFGAFAAFLPAFSSMVASRLNIDTLVRHLTPQRWESQSSKLLAPPPVAQSSHWAW